MLYTIDSSQQKNSFEFSFKRYSCCGCHRFASLKSLCLFIFQNVLVSLFLQEWPQTLSVNWIPPTMCTLDDHIKVIRVDVSIVFLSVFSNCKANFVFHGGGNRVFGSVHVCDLCVNQTLREFLPSAIGDIVVLPDVQAPNLTRRLLKNSKQMHHLVVSHSQVKVLNDKNSQKWVVRLIEAERKIVVNGHCVAENGLNQIINLLSLPEYKGLHNLCFLPSRSVLHQ